MFKIDKELKENLKLLSLGLLAAVIFFIIGNWGYFWQNIRYEFGKPLTVNLQATATQPKSAPDTLTIPSLGVNAPVQSALSVNENLFQSLLLSGVVHYPGTAQAGNVGNDYIFGHSSDYIWSKGHYKTVFALLPKLRIGDHVMISDSTGKLFTYQVIQTKVVSTTDLSVLSQETQGEKILTLQTSYPVGTALRRFVAICELTN